MERLIDSPCPGARDQTLASKFDQLDFFLLAGLKAHRRPGGDIQPHSAGAVAFEGKSAVDLEKMVMTTDLNRAIPRMLHHHAGGTTADVRLNRLRFQDVLSRFHSAPRRDGIVH